MKRHTPELQFLFNWAMVKDWLDEHQMTQAQLAAQLDMPRSSLNRYMTGEYRNVSLSLATKIAKVMGVSLNELRVRA